MDRFGDWTVIAHKEGRRSLCRCICGTVRPVVTADLRSGRSKNCGCSRRVTAARAAANASRIHGMEKDPVYRTWVDMRRRCSNPQRPDFKNYGGRGITVCDQWKSSFLQFYSDMGPRPDGHTLDRIDNDGPYSPSNCRWSPRKSQERNKRTSRFVEIDGRRMTVVEACEVYGIKKATALNRLGVLGWSVEATFKTPVTRR